MNRVITTGDTKDVLIRARALIEDGWTRESYARDNQGHPVSVSSDYACKFCMQGALDKVEYSDIELYREAVYYAREMIREIVPDRSITDFNDVIAENVDDVLAVFDKAIERCSA